MMVCCTLGVADVDAALKDEKMRNTLGEHTQVLALIWSQPIGARQRIVQHRFLSL